MLSDQVQRCQSVQLIPLPWNPKIELGSGDRLTFAARSWLAKSPSLKSTLTIPGWVSTWSCGIVNELTLWFLIYSLAIEVRERFYKKVRTYTCSGAGKPHRVSRGSLFSCFTADLSRAPSCGCTELCKDRRVGRLEVTYLSTFFTWGGDWCYWMYMQLIDLQLIFCRQLKHV